MKKLFLGVALLAIASACKNTPTDPSQSQGCGDGNNPDSLFAFRVTGGTFAAIDQDPPSQGNQSLSSRLGKDGKLRYTVARSISIASQDTFAVFSLTIPKWESGEYAWEKLDRSFNTTGAYLVYSWQDRTTYEYVMHEYFSVSGGATLKVDGLLNFKDTTVLLGTFCGTLRDSLNNEIKVEDGLIHMRFDR